MRGKFPWLVGVFEVHIHAMYLSWWIVPFWEGVTSSHFRHFMPDALLAFFCLSLRSP
jgi:hypothetical protein